jgi:hypothetical protein
MIKTGIDGLSRGSLPEGVMAGIPYLNFFSLNETAFERSPLLIDDFKDMIPFEDLLTVLKPRDWFERGHDIQWLDQEQHDRFFLPTTQSGTYIWQPAPSVAKYAIEELRKAKLKQHKSCHGFVCPRMFTTKWRKQLYKVADIIF